MKIRALASSKRFGAFLCASLVVISCGAAASAPAASSIGPTLISVSAGSTRAVALESVSMTSEPFSLSAETNFSPNDPRTRITLFVMNLDLLAGETLNSLSADAEDAAHVHYPLKVEYVGQVPSFEGIYMVVMRLNDLMPGNLGDVLIRLNLHGMGSNRVRVAIGQIGGGPADDPGAVGTPAPQTPPTPATPLTLLYPQFYPASPPAAPCDGTTTCFRDNYTLYPLQKQFFTNALTQPDQLRQRVAFALHQLIVVGGVQLNGNETSWYAPYLQTIDRNAFGNFRTLLFEVTLNPGMGEYLNMRGNSVNGGNPNENYAREIMQLFSIGVDTLNQDGTPVLDAQGNRVPSYDQTTIANLARVFTGWDLAASKPWSVDNTVTVINYRRRCLGCSFLLAQARAVPLLPKSRPTKRLS